MLPKWTLVGGAPSLKLPKIWPQFEGIFIDYLVRRVVWEVRNFKDVFDDKHIEFYYSNSPVIDDTDVLSVYFDYDWQSAYMTFLDEELPTDKVIFEVLMVSAVQHYKEYRANDYFARLKMWVDENKDNIETFIAELKGFLSPRVENLVVQYTPSLSSQIIKGADADLIIGSCLVDIKTIKTSPGIRELYQLLGYATLGLQRGLLIDNVEIWNFFLGTVDKIDISQWTRKSEFLGFLETGELHEIDVKSCEQVSQDEPFSPINFILQHIRHLLCRLLMIFS